VGRDGEDYVFYIIITLIPEFGREEGKEELKGSVGGYKIIEGRP
jgi:hypothetical protein